MRWRRCWCDRAARRRPATTTKTGLKIYAELDQGRYPTGIKVSEAAIAALNLKRADFHGDWNYTLLPTRKKS